MADHRISGPYNPRHSAGSGAANPVTGTMAGKSFHLVYAPGVDAATFLHLNQEGTHWKLRRYKSATEPAEALLGSGLPGGRRVADLASIEIQQRAPYPYSTTPNGVSVNDSRYWFDQIARRNVEYGIGQ